MGHFFWDTLYILKVKKLAESTHQARKIEAKKYKNGDDNKSRQEYVNHEIYDKMAYLFKNMILVQCKLNRFCILRVEFGGKLAKSRL